MLSRSHSVLCSCHYCLLWGFRPSSGVLRLLFSLTASSEMPLHFGFSLEMVHPSHDAKPFSWPFLGEPVIWRNSLSFKNHVTPWKLSYMVSVGQSYNVCQNHSIKKLNRSSIKSKGTDEDGEVERLSHRNRVEEERRRKIGEANKGRVPWNKGKQHTEETRLRIKQRTIEALKNPEVRKKMSEHPQPHSDETKEKIRSSAKQIWAKRSKRKRLKEKFISSWTESIAEVGRKGGRGEVELEWDSYDRIREEILSEQLQQAAEKAREKEEAKLRADQAKAEKIRKLDEKKKEREEKLIDDVKKASKRSGMKLKKRLTKIRKRKGKLERIAKGKERVDLVMIPHEGSLDLERIKRERMVSQFSLADQIQAAKTRRNLVYHHSPHT